jgi:exosortase/archaeosortase family protein
MASLRRTLKPLNMSFSKDDATKTGRFVLYFILIYLVLSVAITAAIPVQTQELFVANNVLGMLQLFGYTGQVSLDETALISLDAGPRIAISDLCTGLMETLIIVGAILASAGISLRRRLIGAAVGAVATILFNYVRIIITALVILGTGDLALIEFTHNVLFRIFLFLAIAGIYIAWFYWAVSREGHPRERENLKKVKGVI